MILSFANGRLGLACALFVLGSAAASDWPRWRGPMNDGHVPSGERVPLSLPPEPKIVWKQPAGDGLASPVVSRGKVFLFDGVEGREVLKALSREDGRERWRVEIDTAFSDSQGPTGPRCTPVVDEERIYAVSCRGELQCLDVERGALIWRANYVRDFGAVFIGEKGAVPGAARHGNNGSPLIAGARLFACVGGTNGSSVVCFDKRSGKVLWKSEDDMAGYAPPVLGDVDGKSHLLAYTASGVLALDPANGAFLWRHPIKTAYGRHVTTPVIHANHVVISSHQAGLMALKVHAKGMPIQCEPAWIQKETAINFSSPVAVGPTLFGVGPARNLICVEIPSGKLRWSKDGLFTSSADKATASFIVMGLNVLMLADSGLAVLFEASNDQYRELGRAQLCGMNWCSPAYADGQLFLRDGVKKGGDLYCINLMP